MFFVIVPMKSEDFFFGFPFLNVSIKFHWQPKYLAVLGLNWNLNEACVPLQWPEYEKELMSTADTTMAVRSSTKKCANLELPLEYFCILFYIISVKKLHD